MALPETTTSKIEGFFSSVAPYQAAQDPHTSISYVAMKDDTGTFVLVQGRMFLTTAQRQAPLQHFQTENVRAGHFLLSEVEMQPEAIVQSLIEGRLHTPIGTIEFPPPDGGQHFTNRMPFHAEGLSAGNRLDVLSIIGRARQWLVRQPEFDWELKAAATPYDSVAELLHDYQLGTLQGDAIFFELVANNVAVVDFSSVIEGTRARPGMLLAAGLNPELASLGYRVQYQGKVVDRGMLQGLSMKWEARGLVQAASAELGIPQGAVVHCIASYAGLAQHQGWLVDHNALPNAQRAVFETFDPGLATLQEFIDRSGAKGSNARDLEQAAAWVLSMMGFRVMHLGGIEKTQDAVDIIAVTPENHFLLVECTTGLLKADKVGLLILRVERARRRLVDSGNSHLKVLPVMMSSRPRAEVQASVDAAERLGVLVLCREEIDDGLRKTQLLPEPDTAFAQAEQTIAQSLARFGRELPFGG